MKIMKNLEEKIKVMQAFNNGSLIQIRPVVDYDNEPWIDCNEPSWDWETYSYQIKPIINKETSVNNVRIEDDVNKKIEFHSNVNYRNLFDGYRLEKIINIHKITNYPGENLIKVTGRNVIEILLDLVTFSERDCADGRVPFCRRLVKTCYQITIKGERNLNGFFPSKITKTYVTNHINAADLINLLNRMTYVLKESYDIAEVDRFFRSTVDVVDYKKPEQLIKLKRDSWLKKEELRTFPEYPGISFKLDPKGTPFGPEIIRKSCNLCEIVINKTCYLPVDTKSDISTSIITIGIFGEDNKEKVYSTTSMNIDPIIDFVYNLYSYYSFDKCVDEFEKYFEIYE